MAPIDKNLLCASLGDVTKLWGHGTHISGIVRNQPNILLTVLSKCAQIALLGRLNAFLCSSVALLIIFCQMYGILCTL